MDSDRYPLDLNGHGTHVAGTIAEDTNNRNGADVINLSLAFPNFVESRDIPDVMRAIRSARRHGVVVTAVTGNEASASVVPYPGRAPA